MASLLGALPIALMAYGAVAVLWSSRYAMAARQFRDPRQALLAVRGIRLVLLDGAAIGVGAGLWAGLDVLVGLVLVVGALELFESTVAIDTLRRQTLPGPWPPRFKDGDGPSLSEWRRTGLSSLSNVASRGAAG